MANVEKERKIDKRRKEKEKIRKEKQTKIKTV